MTHSSTENAQFFSVGKLFFENDDKNKFYFFFIEIASLIDPHKMDFEYAPAHANV